MRRRSIAIAAAFAGLMPVLAAAAYGQIAVWPSEYPPRALSSKSVDFPPYEIRTLANGMQVIVVEQDEQPIVSLRLLVRAGAASDPAGKSGVATLAARLLSQGAGSRDAQELADAIESIGGAMDTTAGADVISAGVLVMTDGFAFGMDLLSDVVRRPAFSAEELERQRRQLISALQVNFENPAFIASAVLNRLIYGQHPYGQPDTGTPESLARITRDDVQAFHARYFAPNNSILAIVGDVEAPAALAAAERAFGDWPRREIPASAFPAPPRPARRVIVVDKPDAVQTAVLMGQLGVPRKTQGYMALDQMVRLLGGEGSNRLHRVLRSERSLTYSAAADLNTMLLSGDITARTDTRSEATAEAARLMVEEFWRLQRERTSDRELAGVQAFVAGGFPLGIETPAAIARQIVNAVFFDLPLDELRTFRQRVTNVTPDDVQRAARVHLSPDRLAVVMVGDAAAFKDRLDKAGFGRYELISLDRLDLDSPDFRRHD